MGMMVQMIEEANAHNVSLVNEYQKGLAQNRVLEREVTHSEQRYRALFEAASDATFLVDLEGHKIIEVNQSAYRLFSRNGGALVGSVFTDICPGLQPVGNGLMEDQTRYEEFFNTSNDCQVFRTDGTSFAAHGEAKLVNSNKRPVMQISLHEVSEQARVEQKLRKAEKLSALGTLVAGVAHELNNPLAVIMGYSQLLSQGDHLPEKSRAKLEKLVHESERAAKIVRNLLTFARPRDPQMTVVDINALATAVVDACEAQGEAHEVEIEKRLAADLPLTKADSNQIEQVLTNLVSNGIQAMSKHDEQRVLRVTTGVYGAFIRIAVEDTGPGIPPEVVPRIFEPFYTTRAPGEGTGLGLSISQTILEEHHGKIWVQSTLGRGAKFFVELPVVACARTNEAGLPCRSAIPSGPATAKLRSGRRILLVDDEPGILDVLKEALSYQGYQIQTAESGKAALERLEKETFDLIVSDLRMPEIGGEKLYHAVRKLDPGLANRIIFVTGDTVNHKSRTFLEWTGNQWFSKPFDVVELERTIDNFLLENVAAEDEEEAEVPAEVATA